MPQSRTICAPSSCARVDMLAMIPEFAPKPPTPRTEQNSSGPNGLAVSFAPYASCFLPAFLAAAHLLFITNASRFRPSALSVPRRERDGAAALFGAVPAPAALLAAQRFFVASMILLRPSGLRRLFRDLP